MSGRKSWDEIKHAPSEEQLEAARELVRQSVATYRVAHKIADLITRAPAGGIFHDSTLGAVEGARQGPGSDFRIDLSDGDAFVVSVTPLLPGWNIP